VTKLIGLLVAVLCLPTASLLGKTVHVKGHTKKDGTYVAPHVRTSPNGTKNDNYSTKGNVNPYTGKEGTKPRDGVASGASMNGVTPTATPAAEPKMIGWLAVRSGMPETELKRQLGTPRVVEDKGDWSYPTGTVFVKEGRVIAWKPEKRR